MLLLNGVRYSWHLCVGVCQVNEQVQAVVVTSNAQSQMSIETVDNHCQTTPDVIDSTVQTEHHDVQTGAQTELSIAWRADCEAQAVVTVSESAMQASVQVNVIDCQTDSSMANLLSRDVQAGVDVTCSESQTDQRAQSDTESQTEVCSHFFQYCCRNCFFIDVLLGFLHFRVDL